MKKPEFNLLEGEIEGAVVPAEATLQEEVDLLEEDTIDLAEVIPEEAVATHVAKVPPKATAGHEEAMPEEALMRRPAEKSVTNHCKITLTRLESPGSDLKNYLWTYTILRLWRM